MKKAISLLLVCIMVLLATSATAEEFALRNGISFGDTMEEVLAKENFEIDEIDGGSSEDDTTDTEAEYPYSITTVKGTVAGISDSYVWYRFDSEKTLREVVYYFKDRSDRDMSDSDYESLYSGLVRKYGSPLGYSNGSCYIFMGSAIISAALITYFYEEYDAYGDLRDYDEWDVEANDYHVKIEVVQYYTGLSYSDLTYSIKMSYTYFTDEDFAAAQEEKQQEREAVDNDL